jgi:hypothetical protein
MTRHRLSVHFPVTSSSCRSIRRQRACHANLSRSRLPCSGTVAENARMDPWKLYRLLACTAVMLAILGAGACVGVYQLIAPRSEADTAVAWRYWRQRTNPFVRLCEDYTRAKLRSQFSQVIVGSDRVVVRRGRAGKLSSNP